LPPEPPLPDPLPPVEASELAVLENDVATLVPNVRMDPMQTAMIKLNITAYSTAVGPSSSTNNLHR
jgi:hypothetical protein